MEKRVTIYDIAKDLNITAATVSRALNNNKQINSKTKEAVIAAAKRLNYKPNAIAHHLRTGGSKIIGVVVPKVDINFFSNAIAGIEEVASINNYNIIICQSDDQFDKEKKAIETLIKQNVACIIISLASGTTNTAHLAEAIRHNIELIQFDRTDETLNTHRVINEIENIVFDMVKHLADQGYKNIAYLAGPQNIDIFRKRKEAFQNSLLQLGFPVVDENIVYYDLTREDAKKSAKALLSIKKRPDAIIASSDMGALGAWETAKEMNIQVPEAVGICGFSNEFYTELTTPTISSVNQFSKEMGRAACQIFFDSKHAETTKMKTLVIQPQFVVRQSTQKNLILNRLILG